MRKQVYRGLVMIIAIMILIAGCSRPGHKNGLGSTTGGNGQASGNTAQPSDETQPAPQEQPNAGTGKTPPPVGGKPAGPPSAGSGQPVSQPQSESVQKRIGDMTLDEKIGAMIVAGVGGKMPNASTKRMIAAQHVGGVILYKENLSDARGVAAYTNQLKAWNKGNPSALIISVDQEGGKVSRLPGVVPIPNASAIGAAGDVSYAAKIGGYLGAVCRAMGFNVDYAPVLDINSNPDNPVIGVRAYGSDAATVTRTGLKVMGGIRSAGVVPVVKHFPGHGDTAVDSHLELPVVHKSKQQLQAFEWKPFQSAIRNGADVVMVAHILFPALDGRYPASLSRNVITGELRGTLGYKGVVITDDLTMGAIAKNYGMGEAAVRSINAGSDLLLVAHGYDNVDAVIAAIRKSVKNGTITEDRLDQSLARILALKDKYKLTDKPVSAEPKLARLNASIRKSIEAQR